LKIPQTARHNLRIKLPAVTLVATLLCIANAICQAAVYPLAEQADDLIGQLHEISITADDTLLDIARQSDLGYNEIVAANPGVDPWLPVEGTPVVIPTYFIIPTAPRDGIIINLAEMRLYYFPPVDNASPGVTSNVMTFPIGIGQEGWSTPLGVTYVTEKIVDPAWTVPDSIIEEYTEEGHSVAKIMPPGPENPLGRFALRLEIPGYLIHGTNRPFGVGRRISHGCIRMYPEDIEELFQHVLVGTAVWIVDQPYKIGQRNGDLMLEAHDPIVEPGQKSNNNLEQIISTIGAITDSQQKNTVRDHALQVALQHSGIPRQVAEISNHDVSTKGWVLQLGAFAQMNNALQLAAKIESLDLAVSIKARANDGYCHVLVGPYDTQAAVMEIKEKLVQATGVSGKLLPANRNGLISDCIP